MIVMVISLLLRISRLFLLKCTCQKNTYFSCCCFYLFSSVSAFLTVITFLQAANTGTIYTVASTLQWVPVIIHSLVFIFV